MLAACALLIASRVALAADTSFWGAQTIVDGANLGSVTEIDVLNISGEAGETVYLTAMDGGQPICRYLPHELGEGAQGDVADTFAIETEGGLDEAKLQDGSYTVEAYDRRGGTKLYSGTVWGVWARIDGGDGPDITQLIGTRTAADGDAFTFVPPTTISVGANSYSLKSNTPTMEGNLAYFEYESFDPSSTVDGIINYVDLEGKLIKTETIPGIPAEGSKTQEIPAVITADGKSYRTMARRSSVTATSPGQTSFVITCAPIDSAPYVCRIEMVADDDTVIAADSVNVDGAFNYVAPSVIYKNVVVNGETRMVTYRLVDQQVWPLDSSADQDEVFNGSRTIRIAYAIDDFDEGTIDVVYNQIYGHAQDGTSEMLLGTEVVTVDEMEPTAEPSETITVNGVDYHIATSPSDYTYTYGSGEMPVIDVYYVPEGYEAGSSYDVTVAYVNFTTGQTISSETHTVSPDEPILTVDTPASFDRDGVTYIRLDGQGQPIRHNFYSLMRSYTVYYRDSNDTLSAGTVVTRTRVVYQDGVTTVVTRPGTTNPGTTNPGTTPAPVALDQTTDYRTVDGDGDQTLVTEDGRDSNSERIEDESNPLADGTDGQGDEAEGDDEADGDDADGTTDAERGGFDWLGIVLAIIALLVAGGASWWFFVSRRRNDDEGVEGQDE